MGLTWGLFKKGKDLYDKYKSFTDPVKDKMGWPAAFAAMYATGKAFEYANSGDNNQKKDSTEEYNSNGKQGGRSPFAWIAPVVGSGAIVGGTAAVGGVRYLREGKLKKDSSATKGWYLKKDSAFDKLFGHKMSDLALKRRDWVDAQDRYSELSLKEKMDAATSGVAKNRALRESGEEGVDVNPVKWIVKSGEDALAGGRDEQADFYAQLNASIGEWWKRHEPLYKKQYGNHPGDYVSHMTETLRQLPIGTRQIFDKEGKFVKNTSFIHDPFEYHHPLTGQYATREELRPFIEEAAKTRGLKGEYKDWEKQLLKEYRSARPVVEGSLPKDGKNTIEQYLYDEHGKISKKAIEMGWDRYAHPRRYLIKTDRAHGNDPLLQEYQQAPSTFLPFVSDGERNIPDRFFPNGQPRTGTILTSGPVMAVGKDGKRHEDIAPHGNLRDYIHPLKRQRIDTKVRDILSPPGVHYRDLKDSTVYGPEGGKDGDDPLQGGGVFTDPMPRDDLDNPYQYDTKNPFLMRGGDASDIDSVTNVMDGGLWGGIKNTFTSKYSDQFDEMSQRAATDLATKNFIDTLKHGGKVPRYGYGGYIGSGLSALGGAASIAAGGYYANKKRSWKPAVAGGLGGILGGGGAVGAGLWQYYKNQEELAKKAGREDPVLNPEVADTVTLTPPPRRPNLQASETGSFNAPRVITQPRRSKSATLPKSELTPLQQVMNANAPYPGHNHANAPTAGIRKNQFVDGDPYEGMQYYTNEDGTPVLDMNNNPIRYVPQDPRELTRMQWENDALLQQYKNKGEGNAYFTEDDDYEQPGTVHLKPRNFRDLTHEKAKADLKAKGRGFLEKFNTDYRMKNKHVRNMQQRQNRIGLGKLVNEDPEQGSLAYKLITEGGSSSTEDETLFPFITLPKRLQKGFKVNPALKQQYPEVFAKAPRVVGNYSGQDVYDLGPTSVTPSNSSSESSDSGSYYYDDEYEAEKDGGQVPRYGWGGYALGGGLGAGGVVLGANALDQYNKGNKKTAMGLGIGALGSEAIGGGVGIYQMLKNKKEQEAAAAAALAKQGTEERKHFYDWDDPDAEITVGNMKAPWYIIKDYIEQANDPYIASGVRQMIKQELGYDAMSQEQKDAIDTGNHQFFYQPKTPLQSDKTQWTAENSIIPPKRQDISPRGKNDGPPLGVDAAYGAVIPRYGWGGVAGYGAGALGALTAAGIAGASGAKDVRKKNYGDAAWKLISGAGLGTIGSVLGYNAYKSWPEGSALDNADAKVDLRDISEGKDVKIRTGNNDGVTRHRQPKHRLDEQPLEGPDAIKDLTIEDPSTGEKIIPPDYVQKPYMMRDTKGAIEFMDQNDLDIMLNGINTIKEHHYNRALDQWKKEGGQSDIVPERFLKKYVASFGQKTERRTGRTYEDKVEGFEAAIRRHIELEALKQHPTMSMLLNSPKQFSDLIKAKDKQAQYDLFKPEFYRKYPKFYTNNIPEEILSQGIYALTPNPNGRYYQEPKPPVVNEEDLPPVTAGPNDGNDYILANTNSPDGIISTSAETLGQNPGWQDITNKLEEGGEVNRYSIPNINVSEAEWRNFRPNSVLGKWDTMIGGIPSPLQYQSLDKAQAQSFAAGGEMVTSANMPTRRASRNAPAAITQPNVNLARGNFYQGGSGNAQTGGYSDYNNDVVTHGGPSGYSYLSRAAMPLATTAAGLGINMINPYIIPTYGAIKGVASGNPLGVAMAAPFISSGLSKWGKGKLTMPNLMNAFSPEYIKNNALKEWNSWQIPGVLKKPTGDTYKDIGNMFKTGMLAYNAFA